MIPHLNLMNSKQQTLFRSSVIERPKLKNPQLVLFNKGYPSRTYPLWKEATSIGSAPQSDIQIRDPYISAKHCLIEKREDSFFLVDFQSRNGTFLNNILIKETSLTHHSYVQIGKSLLQFEYRTLPKTIDNQFEGMISQNPLMQNVFNTIDKVAKQKTTVIIYGETGTGKELVARAIHKRSDRSRKPFVVINCGAIPKDLLESELFGHVKGAFTGAHENRPGHFMAAHGGTLFLDEVGELPLELQPKLLRVLEQREIKPVGTEKIQKCDVRIIAATHKDLSYMVQEETFREDLFYRLHLVPIYLPPLRDRKEDIPLLVKYFSKDLPMTSKALKLLVQHYWPGNIRELKNTLERIQITQESPVITEKDIQTILRSAKQKPFAQTLLQMEKNLIHDFLEKNEWNKSATARALAIPKSTLMDKIKRYHLSPRK